jgi:hypothetical protein
MFPGTADCRFERRRTVDSRGPDHSGTRGIPAGPASTAVRPWQPELPGGAFVSNEKTKAP